MVDVFEMIDVAGLARAIADADVMGVALDAPAPEDLVHAVTVARPRPVRRPIWRNGRNSRGEVDELFDGDGVSSAIASSAG